jgi:hypothetical protein
MLKMSHSTSSLDHARVSENLNVERLVVMNVYRRNGWPRAAVSMIRCAAAQHASGLGNHESELGNASAGAGGMFDEENSKPGVRRVASKPHQTNAAASDRGGNSSYIACLPISEDGHRAPHHQTLARLLLHSLRLFLLYGRCQSFVNNGIFFTSIARENKQNDRLVNDRSFDLVLPNGYPA